MKKGFFTLVLLAGIAVRSHAQVIVNSDGSHSVIHGNTIVNSNGSHSIVHGDRIVHSEGSRIVVYGNVTVNSDGMRIVACDDARGSTVVRILGFSVTLGGPRGCRNVRKEQRREIRQQRREARLQHRPAFADRR